MFSEADFNNKFCPVSSQVIYINLISNLRKQYGTVLSLNVTIKKKYNKKKRMKVVSYFRIPKIEKLRKILVKERILSMQIFFVCSKHFTEESFAHL